MPNIKSAKKRVLVINSKTQKNRMQKTALKTTLKKLDLALEANDKEVLAAAYANAVKAVDKSASKGLIHKNKAARIKAQMAKKIA